MMGLKENQLDMFPDTVDQGSEEGESHIGKRVMVYFNLHKKTFSIQYKGLVIAHANYVKLMNVEFRVRQGGKEKVRVDMSKNVHAFVIGDLQDFVEYPSNDMPSASGSKSITYDPYKYDTFVYRDTEEPVMNAREVEMINQPGGKIFQINEVVSLNEDSISYDSSKIDEFIIEARKDVEMGKNLINKFGVMISNTTLKDVFENTDQMKGVETKLNDSEKYLTKKFGKFFDIVNMYDFGDYPDNVSVLDDLATELDNQSLAVSDLAEVIEALIYATDKLSKYNEEILKTQKEL